MGACSQYIDSNEEFKIKLDTNEIFMNIDDNVIMKMKSSLSGIELYRYPENEMKAIRELYGKYAEVDPENVIVGNGSDEVLELIIGKVVKPESKILTLGPDFVMYDFFGKRFRGELIKYNIGSSMSFNVDEFIKLGKENDVEIIIFSNPNNPTGINITAEDIIKLIMNLMENQ